MPAIAALRKAKVDGYKLMSAWDTEAKLCL